MVSAQGYNSSSIIGTQLGVEGIREFLVVTNNFKAEYGMVVGSQTIDRHQERHQPVSWHCF